MKYLLPAWLATVVLFNPGAAWAENTLDFAPAVYREITREKYVEGLVEAVNQATLTAQTTGEVLEVNFDVDDYVEKGALLVQLKAAEQQASTAQNRAQLAEARALLKAAQAEHDRIKKIYDKRAISASAMDKAKADLEVARARLAGVRAVGKRSTTQEDYTTIIAPYSGVVIERHIEPGEIANVGSPIMSGMSLDALRVIAYVSQTQINAVREHQTARVVVESDADRQEIESTALTISPQAYPPSHTFKVRVDLPPKPAGLFPGMYVKVGFVVGKERALTIPARAVAYRGEVRGVYVNKGAGGKPAMRMVRLGARHGEDVEVLAGLSEGEEVALDPVAAAVLRKSAQPAPAGGH